MILPDCGPILPTFFVNPPFFKYSGSDFIKSRLNYIKSAKFFYFR